MNVNLTKWVSTCVVVLAMAATLAGQTVRPNRITQGATAGGMVTVPGTVHRLVKQSTDMGPVASQIQMESLSLSTNLSAAQQRDLDGLLAAQQDTQSPLYHKWLTQEEYGARFGLTDADLNAVTGWLSTQGLKVTSVSRSRNTIYFSGKVWQVESAFHTQMHILQVNGETHIANTTAIQVPGGIAKVLLNVRGLNNFRPKPHLQKRQEPATTFEDGNGNYYNFLSPADWATIYDVNPIYSQTCGSGACDGTGMHVGIVGQTYINPTDVLNFRNAAGLSTAFTYLHPICIDTTASHCTGTASISTTGDQGEADLDIEWAGGIAKGATVDFIYAPYEDVCPTSACNSLSDPSSDSTYGYYSAFDALEHAVKDCRTVSGTTVCDTSASAGPVLPVISMSYGDCEESYVQYPDVKVGTYLNWVTSIGQQASAQGQTLLASAGDWGPFTCDAQVSTPESYATLGVYVDIPADSPNFTGVGGTTLSGDEGAPSSYWYETNGQVNSAKQYIPESVWNDTTANASAGYPGLSAGGGGASTYFSQPTWQNGLVSGQTGRMVPDVSFAASADHDGYLVCSADDSSTKYGAACGKGFLSGPVSGNYYFGTNVYGGTSASSPSFAGMLTLIVQKYGNQGNINPTLYALAARSTNYSTIFHAGSGNNVTPCTPATTLSTDTDCPSSGEFGYTVPSSFPFYSMAAGLGSIDGYQLFQALGVANNGAASTTTMTASPTSVTINGTVTLTATVTGASGTPTGTVLFFDGAYNVGSATLGASGTATLSNLAVTAANHFTAGTDSITASYAGDATYAPSTSAASPLTVAQATTSTTVVASPTSVAIGSPVTLTATVSPNTATGVVNYSIGSTNLGAAVVSNGTAPYAYTASLANGFSAGSVTITATYSGDTDNTSSTSSVTITVNKGPTTITVSAPSNTNLGAQVTLMAVLPGQASATGTVTFKSGANTVGTMQLSGGSAILNTVATTANGFTLGSNLITAVYAGDSNYLGSTSNTWPMTVTSATTTTLTATPTSIALGSSTATANLSAMVTA